MMGTRQLSTRRPFSMNPFPVLRPESSGQEPSGPLTVNTVNMLSWRTPGGWYRNHQQQNPVTDEPLPAVGQPRMDVPVLLTVCETKPQRRLTDAMSRGHQSGTTTPDDIEALTKGLVSKRETVSDRHTREFQSEL